jgi:hypothetical protein
MKHMLVLCLLIAPFTLGCRDAAEFFSFTGKPEGADGWLQDYEAGPIDVWEAFRRVALDNGMIEKEDPIKMELSGINKEPGSSEKDGYNIKGRVYDKSRDGKQRARLIVQAWYAKSAHGGERQDIARDYTNAVYHVLAAWKGDKAEREKGRVATTSEDPVQDDEAIGYFKVKPADAFAVCEEVAKRYGKVEQAEREKGFIRSTKTNALEKTADDVRMNVYDRTEGESVRVKISVRVRDGKEGKPAQEIAKGYMGEIRSEMEKRFGEKTGG